MAVPTVDLVQTFFLRTEQSLFISSILPPWRSCSRDRSVPSRASAKRHQGLGEATSVNIGLGARSVSSAMDKPLGNSTGRLVLRSLRRVCNCLNTRHMRLRKRVFTTKCHFWCQIFSGWAANNRRAGIIRHAGCLYFSSLYCVGLAAAFGVVLQGKAGYRPRTSA